MLAHIVLLRPRRDVPEAVRDEVIAALEAAARTIPSIRRFQVGRRVMVGRDDERRMSDPFEYAAVIEFDDLRGLTAYMEHPLHEALSARLGAAFETMLAYDYEMRSARDARDLLRDGGG